MPATGRSPPLLLPCLFPFTIGFASLPTSTSHHRHHHSRPELSSCCCRSGHPLFSLCLPPTFPDAQRAGTRLAAAVEAVQPPKHRRPAPLPLCCCSGEETEGRREEREEEEETYDKWALCTTIQQVLSASKELTWTQMAMLKPREISRRKARHN
uniref:Uncharacterized protein n=1 Tax=Oryza rufipogon TaxID=4529 RepID=A0A0E0QEU4_ORYRU